MFTRIHVEKCSECRNEHYIPALYGGSVRINPIHVPLPLLSLYLSSERCVGRLKLPKIFRLLICKAYFIFLTTHLSCVPIRLSHLHSLFLLLVVGTDAYKDVSAVEEPRAVCLQKSAS